MLLVKDLMGSLEKVGNVHEHVAKVRERVLFPSAQSMTTSGSMWILGQSTLDSLTPTTNAQGATTGTVTNVGGLSGSLGGLLGMFQGSR